MTCSPWATSRASSRSSIAALRDESVTKGVTVTERLHISLATLLGTSIARHGSWWDESSVIVAILFLGDTCQCSCPVRRVTIVPWVSFPSPGAETYPPLGHKQA